MAKVRINIVYHRLKKAMVMMEALAVTRTHEYCFILRRIYPSKPSVFLSFKYLEYATTISLARMDIINWD